MRSGRCFKYYSLPVLSLIFGLAAIVLLFPGGDSQDLQHASRGALRGYQPGPRLVSSVPMAMPQEAMCEWTPASAASSMRGALLQAQIANRSSGASSTAIDRAPIRVVRDSYPTYSAVGVDLHTNEVYLQDENLFGLMVFERTTNTPANASFSEPKRRIRGHNTRLEFNCSLYVDPGTGDVYSVNNDMLDHMVVFPRGVEGDVKPMRQLHTPHRTFGIAVDEEAQELYLTVQHPPEVVVYRKHAEGQEKPLRRLEGPRTQLEDAHGIAIDNKNNLLFVANHGATDKDGGVFEPPSITVYPLKASGDVPPLRVIEGDKTQLNWPALIAIDQERGELYVANDMDHSILVFRTTDGGNVSPIRAIRGSRTGLANPTGLFIDTKNKELWVSSMGNHSAMVYSLTADGNVAPLRTIRSAPLGKTAQMIGNPGAVGYDTKREEILVPN